MKRKYPILEYDPTREAIIEPSKIIKPLAEAPEPCVLCFFNSVIDQFKERGLLREIYAFKSEMGKHPFYVFQQNDHQVGLLHPGIGAPLAAGILEEAIAIGCKYFIACGGAGVLDKDIAVGHVIVPNSAIRDEGTSYHYLAPGREVQPSARAVSAIEKVLTAHQIDYLLAKTWSTDAIYRETREKISRRKSEGCQTVEMEAAALFAVAKFRNVHLGQILYGGDDVSGAQWDTRDWLKKWPVREQLVWLAAEACRGLGGSDGIGL